MKKQKGITLIALVVTIIVLLILAGVSIATLTGDNGILTRASNAKETQRGSEVNEIVLLAVNENKISDYSNDIKNNKTTVVEKLFAEGKLTEEERDKLLGLNGETEVDIITIGNIEIDFSDLNDSSFLLKFGQPYSYSYTEEYEGETFSFTITYTFYIDGSVEYREYYNGHLEGSDTMPAGTVKYDGLNIIESGSEEIIGIISPSGMKINLGEMILILSEQGILPAAPEAPTAKKVDYSSITLNDIEGCEYSIDGEKWQDGTLFSNLNSGTKYTFYARYKATASEPASFVSSTRISTFILPGESTQQDYFNYEINSDGEKTVSITRLNFQMQSYYTVDPELVIPKKVIIDGIEYTVTRINGLDGSQYCNNLKYFSIPNTIISINNTEFSIDKNKLISIIVEEGNTVYDSREGCNAIIETATNTLILGCKTTEIPSSVTSIGNNAFNNCNFTSTTIPNNVNSIGARSFAWCDNLTEITIKKGLNNIEANAFYACEALTTIYYEGTESEWQNITIGTGNEYLTGANILYNQ